jgi:hypothetical protein
LLNRNKNCLIRPNKLFKKEQEERGKKKTLSHSLSPLSF